MFNNRIFDKYPTLNQLIIKQLSITNIYKTLISLILSSNFQKKELGLDSILSTS